MLQHKSRIFGFVALLALAQSVEVSETHASGFLVYEVSAASVAKGSAVSAYPDEPSVVWYNPAGMSFMPGYRVQGGGIFATAANEFTPADGGPKVDAVGHLFFLPQIFGTFEIFDWFHAGIGVCTPWGLALEWPEDWEGREFSIKSGIETVVINPSLSFELWEDRLSIGGGFSVIRATVDLTNGLPAAIGGTVRIGGATWGYGGNAGILFRILPDTLHAAFAYRSRFTLSFEGKGDFTLESPELGQELYDQGGDAEITIPDILTLGFMYAPTGNLVLGFDVNYILWSVYDELKINFDSGVEEISERNWRNTAAFRLSADYALPVDGFKIRGGVVYDMNPSPKEYLAPDLPDANRLDFSIGGGYQYDWFRADLGYMLSWFLPTESTTGQEGPEGEYNSMAHLIGITVSFQFGTGGEEDPEPQPQLSSVAFLN
ncbi:MAG: outer membrane protein transport protein [Myxococcota bacterium]|nr:outer membrane protein transport protein [Myxococcota bacterium]